MGGASDLLPAGTGNVAASSRSSAADIAAPRLGRLLAIGSGVLPAAVAVVLVGSLRPELLTRMWLLLARAIELLGGWDGAETIESLPAAIVEVWDVLK